MDIRRNNALPDTSRSVHLSASAGSGKTRALKERYLALLDLLERRGLNSDQAVAITFTDKAAAEIKERVMQGMPEPMLKKIIRGKEDLRISTIHSFCMNLLKRYPLEAGIPPDFGVLDERDRTSLVQRSVEEALEASDRDQALMAPLLDHSADDLVATISQLLAIRSRLKRMEIDADGPGGLLAALGKGMGAGQAESGLGDLLAGSRWREGLRGMEQILRSQPDSYDSCRGSDHLLLAEAKNADSAAGPAQALIPVYFTKAGTPYKRPVIAKKDFKGSSSEREAYAAAYTAVQEMLRLFLDFRARITAGREAQILLTIYLRAAERYQDAKLREGVLDFDDLEIHAYHLLKSLDAPDILYWLDRKILHFLVDEFQDTSDIQWAIIGRLTEELFAGAGAEKPLAPTLFVVGDEKQSIYRFREANYRLIETVRRRMETHLPESSREIRTLDRNYRSTPQIMGAVNQVFSALWRETYIPSAVERTTQEGSVRLIEILPGEGGTSLLPSEASVLARRIRTVVDSATPVFVRAGNAGEQRPARFEDCAVLIQSRTKLKEYEAALQETGIPFRVVGGIGFYEEDEIQAVLNVLFFLWNRDDRHALAAALKSPLFGLSDSDLVELPLEGGAVLDALRERHPGAGALLSDWERYAGTEPLAGLVHRIILDSGAWVRFGRLNQQAVFNLDKLLDTAREFDRRGYTTLQDFVEWVRNVQASEQREATADMNLPGVQGAVSIMTVHKAKGLEFPVVFLPGMNQQTRSVSQGPGVIVAGNDGVRVALNERGNPVYQELWEEEKAELAREHQRLLYVAMTRACDHLIMIGALEEGKKEPKPGTWLRYLHDALPALAETAIQPPCAVESSWPDWKLRQVETEQAVPERTGASLRPAVSVDGKKVLANLAPVAAQRTPDWKRATDYLSTDREWQLEQPPHKTEAALPVSAQSRGSLLHRCLEEHAAGVAFDLSSLAGEFDDIMALSGADRQGFLEECGQTLAALLGNAELGWVFKQQPNAYSELPVLFRKGDDIVSGVIDRVIVDGNRGYVIDYKSVRVESEGALEAWIGHYRPQVRIYCEAVKDIFGLERVEGFLLFLDSARLALTAMC